MEMVKTEADPASNMWAMSAVTLVLTPLPHSFSLPHMKYKATIHSLQFVGKDQCHLLSRAQREHKRKPLSSLLHLLCVLRHSKSEYFSKQNRGRYPQSRTEKTAAHNFLSTKKDNRTNSSFWEMPSIQKPFFYGSLWLSFSENFILANEGKTHTEGYNECLNMAFHPSNHDNSSLKKRQVMPHCHCDPPPPPNWTPTKP